MAERYRIEKWREVYPPNPAMLRLRLEAENYRVFQWSDRPGMTYGSHKHSEDQSHWIISGELEITVERAAPQVLKAGDRDFMPAETYHKARVLGESPVLYLIGEKQPVKRKRGRPKKVKEPPMEELPPELMMLLRANKNDDEE